MTKLNQASEVGSTSLNAVPVIEAKNVSMRYVEAAGHEIQILNNASLSVNAGEMVAIIGASGSGKSTLLHLLGLLDHPSSGSLFIHGQLADDLNEKQRSRLRNKELGFVYQFHHLLAEFSALDNVAMPLIVRRERRNVAREKAAMF